jgi:purine-binding chemotaxis protein CheW
VVGTVMLDPERIRWRGQRSKRPWLAGTLIDQMCALFDIAQLAWLFHSQDRKRAPG